MLDVCTVGAFGLNELDQPPPLAPAAGAGLAPRSKASGGRAQGPAQHLAARSDSPVDSDLIERAKGGDRAAREDLAHRYRQPCYLLALQLLGNREDALDVAQDALLNFFSHLDRFDSQRPVLPWLRRIVRNRAVDLHRRKKVRRADSLDSAGPEGAAVEVEDQRVDTELSASLRQRQRLVWRCLQTLSPAQREIVVLRDYQDLAYLEIADALSVPIGTVMSRLHRARAELRLRVLEATQAVARDGQGP